MRIQQLTVITLHYSLAVRTRRSLQYGLGWPPQSHENTIEVLVVLDRSMTDYHGDQVKTYALNLLKMVDIKLLVPLIC